MRLCWKGGLVRVLSLTHPGKGLRRQNGSAVVWFRGGFTIIEILIVVVILAVVAMTAIPMISSAASIQVRSAASMIAADLEYAKSLAISKGASFSVVFDTVTDSYKIVVVFDTVTDSYKIVKIVDGEGETISHPVKKGFDYVVDLQDEGLERVEISSADFGGDCQVRFDYLGSPYNGGDVVVRAAGDTVTISVEPVTGYVTVTD